MSILDLTEELNRMKNATSDREPRIQEVKEEPKNEIPKEKPVEKLIGVLTPDPNRAKIKLGIGTPFYGGQAFVGYMISLINTIRHLESKGVEVFLLPISGESLITRARNNIVAKFLNVKDATHLIFIDADITWAPQEVEKLLAHDKDLSGGIYPLKCYQWENLSKYSEYIEANKNKLNSTIPFHEFLKQNLLRYNLNFKYPELKVQNNLVEVRHIANGFMMIKRNVLEELIEKNPGLKFYDDMGALSPEEDVYAYTLFDCAVIEGHYYSEDWLFCHRWTDLGHEVFCDITINLTHTGSHQFEGRFLSTLNIKL